MIRINLLPEEYRKKSRTPFKLMLGFSAAIGVNTALLAYVGWLVLGVASKVESERQVLQVEMDGLNPQVAYYRSLEKESKQYESREKTLASITKSRIGWTRKLDELIDVVNRGDDGQRHLVWFDDLTVSQTSNARTNNYGSLRAAGHSGSDKFAHVANFLEDLEKSTFVEDFYAPAPPEGTQTVVDETLVPPVVWAFPLSLSLKSPEERETAHAKAEASQTDGAAKGKPGAASTGTGKGATAPKTAPKIPAAEQPKGPADQPKAPAEQPKVPAAEQPKTAPPIAPKNAPGAPKGAPDAGAPKSAPGEGAKSAATPKGTEAKR